jgi:hypothetical protein
VRIALVLLVMLLSGCAGYSGRGLVPGQASADEVEALMGPSADRRPGANGETVRYYSRLPFGKEIYAARFDPAGRLIAIEQRLTEDNLAKIRVGNSRTEDVRDILGPPYRMDAFPRLQRDIWTYPAHGQTIPKLIIVQFSNDRVVREVYMMDDPQAMDPSFE